MEVQTYEVEEIKDELGVMAADSEALELIQKLGLEGQQQLSNPDTATRFPYRKLTALEHRVFKQICPQETSLKKYNSGPVPLRVLQVAAHVSELQPDWTLKVWHPEDWRKDPVLLASTQEYGGDLYLLARWAEALESFDELIPKAKAIWTAAMRLKLAECKNEIENDTRTLDLHAESLFSGGKDKSFWYSCS